MVKPLTRVPALPIAAAMAVGIAAAVLLLPATLPNVCGCWCLAAGLLGLWWKTARERDAVACGVLLAAVVCGGAAWGLAWHALFAANELAGRLTERPQPLAVEGRLVEAPRPLAGMLRDPRTGLAVRPATACVLRVARLRVGNTWIPVSGQAAVTINGPPPEVQVGSEVRVFGRGQRPAAAGNPGEFDFRDAARARRRLSLVRCASRDCLEVLKEPPWWRLGPSLVRLRRHGSQLLEEGMSEEMAAFAGALLLGNRDELPRDQTEPFVVTGTIHILAISGLHVGILAWALFGIVRATPVGRGWALLLVATVSGGYMLLVHAEVPVVRATLLVWLACGAAWLGRRPVGLNTLAVVAVLVLLWRPVAVLETGTQLSFLSTATLILLATAFARERKRPDPIARLIAQSRPPLVRFLRAIAGGLLVSVVAGAVVWGVAAPLVAMRFHVVSPIALLLNPLITPLVAVAMGCGLVALVVGLGSSGLAAYPAAACATVLHAIQSIAEFASRIPGAFAWVSGPPLAWVVGWYLAVVAAVVLAGQLGLRQFTRWSLPCVVWLGVGAAAWVGTLMRPAGQAGLEVTMASMQHGLGIVVRPPSGEVLVYDAGRLGAPAAARRAMEAVLHDAGVDQIDVLVISHADADHFNAVAALMRRFPVGTLVVTSAFLASTSPEVEAVIEAAEQHRIPLRVVAAGDTVDFSPTATARVLHPAAEAVDAASDNAVSLVLAVESAGRRLLLAGDLEGEAIERLLAAGVPRCDALVAPHHGSRTSLPPRLAQAVQPRVVLVSGTGDVGWEEVRRAYEQTGPDGRVAEVLCTCQQGAVRLRLETAGIRVARAGAEGWGVEKLLAP